MANVGENCADAVSISEFQIPVFVTLVFCKKEIHLYIESRIFSVITIFFKDCLYSSLYICSILLYSHIHGALQLPAPKKFILPPNNSKTYVYCIHHVIA